MHIFIIPLLSGYPQDAAASIALKCVRNFLESNSSKVGSITEKL